MFKTIATTAGLAVLSSLILANPAAAQSFSPAPGNYTLSGPVTFVDVHSYTCTATVNIWVDAAGAATVLDRSLSGSGGCGTVQVPYGAWAITPGWLSATLAVGFNLGFTTCYGMVSAVLTSPSTFEWPLTTLPGVFSPSHCRARGVLTATPALTVVP